MEIEELTPLRNVFPDIIPMSYVTARKWVSLGKLKTVKIGGRQFMKRAEIERIMDKGLDIT